MVTRGAVPPPTTGGEPAAEQKERPHSPLRRPQTNGVIGLAVALAMIAALAYLMIQLGVLGVGSASGPAGIVYAAAGGYVLGGLLILLRRRWLWMIGATINALVVLFFFSAYHDRPDVIFSAGGLATKAAQVLLEACLIYLILTYRRPKKGRERG